MEPLTIAGLTLCVLAGLVIEYFTGLISAGFAAVRRRVLPANPAAASAQTDDGEDQAFAENDEPAATEAVFGARSRAASLPHAIAHHTRYESSLESASPDSSRVSRSRESRVARSWPGSWGPQPGEDAPARRIGFRIPVADTTLDDRARQAYMPPQMRAAVMESAPAPAPDRPVSHAERPPSPGLRAASKVAMNGRTPVSARPGPLSPEARAEALAAAEIIAVVGGLENVENALAPNLCLEPITPELGRLKDLVVDYDLDNLMAISGNTLNGDVIAFYRDVLTIAIELERHIRSTTVMRTREDGELRLGRGRVALRASVSTAVDRGTQLTQRLGRGASELVNRS